MRALIDDREEGSRKEEAPEIRPEEERIPEENWEEDLEEDWDDLEERLAESLSQVREEVSQKIAQAAERAQARAEEKAPEKEAPAEKEEEANRESGTGEIPGAKISGEESLAGREAAAAVEPGSAESAEADREETEEDRKEPEAFPEKKDSLLSRIKRGLKKEKKQDKKETEPKVRIKELGAKLRESGSRVKNGIKNWYEGKHYLENQEDEISSYRTRIWLNRRKTIIRRASLIIGVLLIVFSVKAVIDHWHYGGYEVLSMMENEESGSQYAEMNGNLLKYSADGASLADGKEDILWSDTFEMTSPNVDICGGTAAIYDQRGSTIAIYNEKGSLGKVATEYPILKVRAASQGVVAAMLEDGENTWLNVYSPSGEKIVASKTRVDSPGYPVNFDLSEDGMLMAVSYLYIEGNTSTSKIVFYNFGNVGQNQTDNIVKEIEYPNLIIPQIEYLDNSTALAFREDGFSVYEGGQIPDEDRSVEIDDEIISAFHDDSCVGVILHGQDGESKYTMRVYGMNGRVRFEENFDADFTTVRISGDNILLYNDTQLCVYSMKGVERFNETIKEGSIRDVYKIDSNRYIAILSTGVCTFKLK